VVSFILAWAEAGCSGPDVWYPAPEQRASLSLPMGLPFGYFVSMSDPNAGAYIVGGFRDSSEGPWRWTHEHPVLRFYVPRAPRLRFVMDLGFPGATFAQTGPVELAIRINGKEFDLVRYDKPGAGHYSRPVPWEWLRADSVNTVALEPDKVAAGPGGERLGFVLTRAGFVE